MMKRKQKKHQRKRESKPSKLNYKKLVYYYFGLIAEFLILAIFTARFYIPLAHRFKSPFGEVDLIFLKNNKVFFFEVKFRTKINTSHAIVTEYQNARLLKAAEYFLFKKKIMDKDAQIDYIYLSLSYPFFKRIQNVTM